jgi:MFS family permease
MLAGRRSRPLRRAASMSAVPDTPPPDLEAEERAYDAFVRENLRRNYIGHYLHGMLGMTGFRLVNAPTFLPAYLFALSGSSAVVGLGLALQQLGSMASPVVGASHVEHRKRVMPVALVLGAGMRLPVLLMAVAGWTLSGAPLLWALLALLFLFGLAGGAQRVVFQMLLAKVIPIERRGRLQAWRNVTGGLIAAVLAYFAGRVLIERQVLGNGYATTFLLAFVLTSLGLTALRWLMREPEPPTVRPQTRLRERVRDFPRLIRGDRDYRNFLVAQVLAMAGRLAAPFYILHAGETVGMSGATIGLFSLAFLGADTLSNLAWGYLGDKTGFRAALVAAVALSTASTLVLLAAQDQPMFLLAFVGLGASSAGYMMSASTLVLEFGGRDDIPMRLALSTTAEGAMAAAGPLAGGLLAASAGYPAVFWTAIVLQAAALAVLVFKVREPRRRG